MAVGSVVGGGVPVSTSAHYVRASLRGALRHGVDVGPLLERSGIDPAVVASGRGSVGGEQFARLTKSLWAALDDELLGFCATPARLGTFAMMAHAVVHCSPDLRAAVRRADRFYRLFPQGPRFRLVEGGELAAVEFDLRAYDDPDRFAAESLLAVWHRSASWLVRRRIALRGVELGYGAPPHALEYGLMFGTTCRFGAGRTALLFDRALLDLPVVQDEAALRLFLERAPLDVLARMEYGEVVSSQVRRLLNAGLRRGETAGMPDLEQVAGRLSVSSQTLRRRLAAEGTSFQRVRDELRRDVAVAALARGDGSLEELSARLGFSEPSAFHRAFRRWTGATPRSYQGSYQSPRTAAGR